MNGDSRKRLKPHQVKALSYCLGQRHPALFMEMRLGKTLVVIRAVKFYGPGVKRVLVVAPNSALDGWSDQLTDEREDWVWLWGRTSDRKAALAHSTTKWFLVNKEAFLGMPELASMPWDVVVLDESTFIKNPKAKVTRFYCQNFRRVQHRFVLTGTPNPESDLEFFCQLQFLDGQFMGFNNFWSFRLQFFQQIFYDWMPKMGAKKKIAQAVSNRAFVMRRKDAGLDIPKVKQVRRVFLDKKTRLAYDKLERDFATELDGHELKTLWSGAKFAWLRQLANGFIKGEMSWSGKVNELLDLLTGELKGEQVVVWFNFNAEIKSAHQSLVDAGIKTAFITGETLLKLRKEWVDEFRRGSIRVLLLQQAVAQTGLDLSVADTAIYFSLPTSLMAIKQTEDRILKMGKSGLLYLYLVTAETVDEDVFQGSKTKGLVNDLSFNRIVREKMMQRIGGI